ncbi:carcinoembryonic antigen-related cell adhesion molecule 2-like [Parambassis ranga]|uniref:Carcinoembryonic antigen-related cell adhesion molecule 2-like n=1 Tax=Parambassis ranga TaxID=210632 RepID=A0A6P7JWM2_9TELE|nr:carcinoembryonic antigen-related cell adhesion molecule 2-like [Parambassis ranga]
MVDFSAGIASEMDLSLLCIVSVAITCLSEAARVFPDGPFNASVGETVTLRTTLTPTNTPFVVVSWKFGSKDIITSHSDVNFTAPEYEDRIAFFPSTASLELRGLTLSDSGEYTVSITPADSFSIVGTTRLDVFVLVSNVTLTSNSTDLVEFSSSVRLSCSSSGSSLSFRWMNSSSEVAHIDRVQITDGGATLIIVNVTRYDQGPFRCHVFNPVSNGTSDPVNLSISYGPENINLMLSPPKEYFEEGSNISLSCSAVSRPPAQYMWFVNGDKLPHTEPELRLTNVQEGQRNYSCQAFNNKTLRYQTSLTSVVSVLEKISGVSVKSSTNLTVEGGMSVNLTCEASGSIFTRTWMKDGVNLILTDNMTLYDNNRVLSFDPVNRKHSSEYFCNVSNPISSDGAKYIMVVNYGPENVRITGLNEITFKHTLKLTCSADSTPAPSYTWILNDQEILYNAPEFIKEEADYSHSGDYTCQAQNDITGRSSSSAVHHVAVTEPSPCPPGCIAGIVIAVCVIIGLIAGSSYFIYKKKSKSSNRRFSEGGNHTNQAFTAQELNYADVNFLKHENSGSVLQPQTNSLTDSSDYAQVKVNNKPPAAATPPSYDVHMQRVKRPAPQPGVNGAQTSAQVHKHPSH